MNKPRRNKRKVPAQRTRQYDKAQEESESTLPVTTEWLPVGDDACKLENARTQWQFGDWQALISLTKENMQSSADRVNLAILCASAHQQLGQMQQAKKMMHLARDWGASKKEVANIMISGVHNTLGRIHALTEDSDAAFENYRKALMLDHNSLPPDYLVKARIANELDNLEKDLTQKLISKKSFESSNLPVSHKEHADHLNVKEAQNNWGAGNWQALVKLDNATLPDQPSRIMLGIFAACGYQQLGNGQEERRCVEMVQQWGASSDQIKKFLLSGVYNRLGRATALLEEYESSFHNFKRSLVHVSHYIDEPEEHLESRVCSQLADISEKTVMSVLEYLDR
ncbi:tetratricopeptide repeat protein [Halomonas sp. LS-001]